MLLHLSVILSTGGGVWQTPPLQADTPLATTPRADTPVGRKPLPKTSTAVDGTHPTAMHSCCIVKFEADEENTITYETL